MKYFAIFNKNVAKVFQLQWNIWNIPDIFLQYSVLFGSIYTFDSQDYFLQLRFQVTPAPSGKPVRLLDYGKSSRIIYIVRRRQDKLIRVFTLEETLPDCACLIGWSRLTRQLECSLSLSWLTINVPSRLLSNGTYTHYERMKYITYHLHFTF